MGLFCVHCVPLRLMEDAPTPLGPPPDPLAVQKKQVEAASDFLRICDGTGHPAGIDGLRQRLLLGRRAAGAAYCCGPGALARLKSLLVFLLSNYFS